MLIQCPFKCGRRFLQEGNEGIERPYGYYSKKLNDHKKYSTIEKETLILVLALQHFNLYVAGNLTEIIVYPDHNRLMILEKFKTKNVRLFRRSLLIQPFDLKIIQVAG